MAALVEIAFEGILEILQIVALQGFLFEPDGPGKNSERSQPTGQLLGGDWTASANTWAPGSSGSALSMNQANGRHAIGFFPCEGLANIAERADGGRLVGFGIRGGLGRQGARQVWPTAASLIGNRGQGAPIVGSVVAERCGHGGHGGIGGSDPIEALCRPLCSLERKLVEPSTGNGIEGRNRTMAFAVEEDPD